MKLKKQLFKIIVKSGQKEYQNNKNKFLKQKEENVSRKFYRVVRCLE